MEDDLIDLRYAGFFPGPWIDRTDYPSDDAEPTEFRAYCEVCGTEMGVGWDEDEWRAVSELARGHWEEHARNSGEAGVRFWHAGTELKE